VSVIVCFCGKGCAHAVEHELIPSPETVPLVNSGIINAGWVSGMKFA